MWWGERVAFHNGAVDQDEGKPDEKNRSESRDEGVGKQTDEEKKMQ